MESSDQSGNWNVMKRYHLIRCWCIAWYLPILSMVGASTSDPLLLRVARGERTTETPVWMMRQAGRHMAAYRDLVDMYPTFRERSETPQVSLDISLQPLNACE